MGAAALPLMIAGTVLTSYSMYQEGQAAKKAANFEASQLEAVAKQKEANAIATQAMAQRKALEAKREGEITQSRAQAVSAASGGGSLDESIVAIMQNLAKETDYRKRVSLYEGDVKAQEMQYSAALDKWSAGAKRQAGKAAAKSATIGAIGTLVAGSAMAGSSEAGKSFFAKYGGGAPKGGMEIGGAFDKMTMAGF